MPLKWETRERAREQATDQQPYKNIIASFLQLNINIVYI